MKTTADPEQPSPARRYTYRVVWTDGNHVGLCDEFPALSSIAPSIPEAITGIVDLVNDELRAMVAHPSPRPDENLRRVNEAWPYLTVERRAIIRALAEELTPSNLRQFKR